MNIIELIQKVADGDTMFRIFMMQSSNRLPHQLSDRNMIGQ
jgi:hypothetical protein